MALKDKPLSDLLPAMAHTLDVLLVDDPLLVDKDVALFKHNLKPRPDVCRDAVRGRASSVLGKESVEVVEALETPRPCCFTTSSCSRTRAVNWSRANTSNSVTTSLMASAAVLPNTHACSS